MLEYFESIDCGCSQKNRRLSRRFGNPAAFVAEAKRLASFGDSGLVMSNSSLAACEPAKDAAFGPGLKCSEFDFTISFEHAILGIGPTSLFLIWSVVRLKQLYRTPSKLRRNIIQAASVVSALRAV